MSNEAKLAELRAKTNGELMRYVSRELNLGIRLATGSDDESHRGAEEIFAELSRLLPVLQDQDPSERGRIESKLHRLRQILDASMAWRTPNSVGAVAS